MGSASYTYTSENNDENVKSVIFGSFRPKMAILRRFSLEFDGNFVIFELYRVDLG